MSSKVVITSGVLISLVLVLLCGTVFAGGTGTGGDPNGYGDPNRMRHHPIPVMKYTMASPRACLIAPPLWSTNAYYLPTGAAENFPRANGAIRVRVGTRVIFCLSRDLEGVWYPHSYGCIGTSMVLQLCRACKCITCDCNKCICADINCEGCRLTDPACPTPEDCAITPCPWVTIGKDGARDCRKGPSIGRAKVGVPIRFKRPGIYYLRAIVHTFAHPKYPRPLEPWQDALLDKNDPTAVLPPIPIAQDRDVVYVRVHVVDLPIDDIEPNDVPVVEPDTKYIRPMPKDIDPNEPIDLNADLNGDEVVNLADLAILGQQWGREYEMPFTDDE